MTAPDASDLSQAARAFADEEAAPPDSLTAAEGEQLVALLVERSDAARLTRLAATGTKPMAKAAKRGLHLLRSRGVAVPPLPPPAAAKRTIAEEEAVPLASLATMIDSHGERAVWLAVPGARGGVDVFQAELSETRGLFGFSGAHLSRKEWRSRIELAVGDGEFPSARIPGAYARYLIEIGYERALAAGRSLPDEFARARLELGPAVRPERHPALELAPPLQRSVAGERLASLHDRPEVLSWLPDKAHLPALDIEVTQVLSSRLVLDDRQRREQLVNAINRVAEQALDPAFRARLGARLLETAYLVVLRGDRETAQLLTTAAELTLDASVPAADNPFVRRLFEKLIPEDAWPKSKAGAAAPDDSLILDPRKLRGGS